MDFLLIRSIVWLLGLMSATSEFHSSEVQGVLILV